MRRGQDFRLRPNIMYAGEDAENSPEEIDALVNERTTSSSLAAPRCLNLRVCNHGHRGKKSSALYQDSDHIMTMKLQTTDRNELDFLESGTLVHFVEVSYLTNFF